MIQFETLYGQDRAEAGPCFYPRTKADVDAELLSGNAVLSDESYEGLPDYAEMIQLPSTHIEVECRADYRQLDSKSAAAFWKYYLIREEE